MSDPDSKDELVLSVDKRIVERFLLLIRDNYQAAERAIFILEERAGILSTAALTNLRDVLSHLSSMLEQGASDDNRRAQLASAEEHMRRAIFDPYAIALGQLRKKHREILSEYRRYVLPRKSKGNAFKDAPDDSLIRTRWEEIVHLAQEGRHAKGRNLWDQSWETGVTSYVKAFDRLSRLNDELASYISNHKGERRQRRQRAYTIASLVGTIGFGVLSVWMVIDPAVPTALRTLFGLAR